MVGPLSLQPPVKKHKHRHIQTTLLRSSFSASVNKVDGIKTWSLRREERKVEYRAGRSRNLRKQISLGKEPLQFYRATANNMSAGERKLLDPSELGTKQYWEAAYERELQNHGGNADDEGVIWFDESNAENTVIRKLSTYDSASGGSLDRKTTKFLDLGTGNGHMLFALREDEDEDENRWLGDMVGVDYSPKSVRLAQQINEQRIDALDDDAYAAIKFEQWDLLTEQPGNWLGNGFDVVLDKGTFDAISLMPKPEDGPHPCEIYRQKVEDLIKPGQFLFITSCNWTSDELVGWLVTDDGKLELHDEAKYRTFTFGGQTGQSVVTLVFRRVS